MCNCIEVNDQFNLLNDRSISDVSDELVHLYQLWSIQALVEQFSELPLSSFPSFQSSPIDGAGPANPALVGRALDLHCTKHNFMFVPQSQINMLCAKYYKSICYVVCSARGSITYRYLPILLNTPVARKQIFVQYSHCGYGSLKYVPTWSWKLIGVWGCSESPDFCVDVI